MDYKETQSQSKYDPGQPQSFPRHLPWAHMGHKPMTKGRVARRGRRPFPAGVSILMTPTH